ncbi:MAG: phosphonoacetaldehyde reductase [Lachnospiraceae bacterium]|nr:phosphonoacetaldehyde reductase [Lachnospiraceae bacterium]
MQTVIKIEDELNILDEHIKKMNAGKIMLVCGSSIRFLRYDSYFRKLQKRLGIEVIRFSDFTPNPTYDSVVKGVEMYNKEQCDMIVAVGGGSAMDVAKCIKLYANMYVPLNTDENQEARGKDADYIENEIEHNTIPFIAIPTTAGTGSEATHFAVIYYKGKKKSVEHESCVPSIVVMDSSVLSELPLYQKKATVLDAFCHAVESYWSVNSTAESKEYSLNALKLLIGNMETYLGIKLFDESTFRDVSMNDTKIKLNDTGIAGYSDIISECELNINNKKNVDVSNGSMKIVYDNMLKASYLAGKAINITKTTAGHAMCYKLTSLYGIAHGQAAFLCVAKLLPYMTRHTDDCIDPRGRQYLIEIFDELAKVLGLEGLDKLGMMFDSMITRLQLEIPDVSDEDYLILKTSVNPERLKNNPVSLNENQIDKLYHEILSNNIQ